MGWAEVGLAGIGEGSLRTALFLVEEIYRKSSKSKVYQRSTELARVFFCGLVVDVSCHDFNKQQHTEFF